MKAKAFVSILVLALFAGTIIFPHSDTARAAPPENEVYILVVAADFENDGEAQLKEWFYEYKRLCEEYLGERIIYDWHYFAQDEIPTLLWEHAVHNYHNERMYHAIIDHFGQRYPQRILLSHSGMEGAEFGAYTTGFEQGVHLTGFHRAQLGIHGEAHSLEGAIVGRNAEHRVEVDAEGRRNILSDVNDQMNNFWLRYGSTHFISEQFLRDLARQYGVGEIDLTLPHFARRRVDRDTTRLVGNAQSRLYRENPTTIYDAGAASELHGRGSIQIPIGFFEMNLMQKLQDEFGVTLASLTPRHPNAVVPTNTATTPVSPPPPVVSSASTDQPSPWAGDAVEMAGELGILPDSFRSGFTQPITRAEFCTLAVALYEHFAGTITGRTTFSDTNSICVGKAADVGIVSGTGNGMFSPDSPLTREQAAVMLARLSDALYMHLAPQSPTFSDNAAISPWAFDSVGQIQAAGIMSGIGNNNFAPQNPYTREQSIATIMRLYEEFRHG